MRKSILSVNGSKAMNYLLKTILGRSFKFVHIEDIFQVAHYLKWNKNTAALLIDLDFQPQLCWELIEHVKTSRLYKVPVIILATDTNENLKEKCYQYGIDEIFFKPFNPEELTMAVKNCSRTLLQNSDLLIN